MISALLLFSASSLSAYTGPRPEVTATYKDWITGCDNQRNCSAIALKAATPDASHGADHLEILIDQPLSSHIDPALIITAPISTIAADQMVLLIDGAPVMLPPSLNGRFVFRGTERIPLLRKMRGGTWAEIRGSDGSILAQSSLAGLTAALVRIDEQQGRNGTEQALASPGTRVTNGDLPGYSVSLTRPAPSSRPATTPNAEAMREMKANEHCTGDGASKAGIEPPIIARLDDENTLLVMPWQCGMGAYNRNANTLIVDYYGQLKPAKFDHDNGVTGDGPSNVLVNVSWDDSKRTLESFIVHRAIGDCGRIDQYIWSGAEFRLSEQRIMPECRGSFDTIRVWKVDVADR